MCIRDSDDYNVNSAAAHKRLADFKRLLAGVRLRNEKIVYAVSYTHLGKLTIKFEMLCQFRKAKAVRAGTAAPSHPLLKFGKLTAKFEML